MATVRAARLREPRGAVAVESVEAREPAAGEVLLRMEACGICHSDLYVSSLEKLPRTPVTLDTPAGLVRATAHVEGGRVAKVSFLNVPSFVFRRDVAVDVLDHWIDFGTDSGEPCPAKRFATASSSA